jgi:hypothetical protein
LNGLMNSFPIKILVNYNMIDPFLSILIFILLMFIIYNIYVFINTEPFIGGQYYNPLFRKSRLYLSNLLHSAKYKTRRLVKNWFGVYIPI